MFDNCTVPLDCCCNIVDNLVIRCFFKGYSIADVELM
jgi:hypothetical protein